MYNLNVKTKQNRKSCSYLVDGQKDSTRNPPHRNSKENYANSDGKITKKEEKKETEIELDKRSADGFKKKNPKNHGGRIKNVPMSNFSNAPNDSICKPKSIEIYYSLSGIGSYEESK